jgi:Protein of unknown function, DUF547
MINPTLQFYFTFLFLFCLTTSTLFGQNRFFENADLFLKKHVESDRLDYKKIKKDKAALNQLIADIQAFPITKSDPNTQKAFWINTYNLMVIKTISKYYPIDSPSDIPDFFTKKIVFVGEEQLSLNEIEKIKLLENFRDARIHFVLVCAAVDCPPITSFAYQAQLIDSQLDKQVSRSLDNPEFLKIDTDKKEAQLSEIFRWYRADFETYGGIRSFINQYKTKPIPDDFKIKYYTYNWALNDIRKSDLTKKYNQPQRYFASALIGRNSIELKVFNSMYTEKRFDGFEKFNTRSTYLSTFIQFLYGLNKNINIGGDIVIKSNVVNDLASSFPTEALSFKNFSTYQTIDCTNPDVNISSFSTCKENTLHRFDTLRHADGRVIQTRSAAGLAHIGPKFKFNPIKRLPNISLQQTLYIPIQKSVDGQFISFTQLFYDQPIKNHSQLFVEASLWTPVSPEFRISPFLKVFYSYFPTNKWTVYAMASIPQEIGAGTKYFITPNLEIEFLYTYYLPIDYFLGDKRPMTFNIGFRYSN